MSLQPKQGIVEKVSEKEVAEYLHDHPDFFAAQPQLLAEMMVPHASGEAVSLIERQVSVLRDQNRKTRREINQLVEIARENDRLHEQLQSLTLALMESVSLSDIFFNLHDALRSHFSADIVTVRLFASPQDAVAEDAGEWVSAAFAAEGANGHVVFQKILDAGKPICGSLSPMQLDYLFRDRVSEVASTALVPLNTWAGSDPATSFGLLGIGSFNDQRFHPAMGTLFLSYMGAILSRALCPYLKL
jgi:uncharacterized protein YigA (DUF484 family)